MAEELNGFDSSEANPIGCFNYEHPVLFPLCDFHAPYASCLRQFSSPPRWRQPLAAVVRPGGMRSLARRGVYTRAVVVRRVSRPDRRRNRARPSWRGAVVAGRASRGLPKAAAASLRPRGAKDFGPGQPGSILGVHALGLRAAKWRAFFDAALKPGIFYYEAEDGGCGIHEDLVRLVGLVAFPHEQ